MSKRKARDRTQVQEEGNDAPADVARGDGRAARKADGRFAPGHCPNPKGRPRKRDTTIGDVLASVLEKTIQDNTPGSTKRMSLKEALAQFLCAKALKDPKLALAILKQAAFITKAARTGDEQDGEEEAGDVLARYVERELRQRTLRQAAAEDMSGNHDMLGEDDPDDEGGAG